METIDTKEDFVPPRYRNGAKGYAVVQDENNKAVQMLKELKNITCDICHLFTRGKVQLCNGTDPHFVCHSCANASQKDQFLQKLDSTADKDVHNFDVSYKCNVTTHLGPCPRKMNVKKIENSKKVRNAKIDTNHNKFLEGLNLSLACGDNNFLDPQREKTPCDQIFSTTDALHAHQAECSYTFRACQKPQCNFVGVDADLLEHARSCYATTLKRTERSFFSIIYCI